MGDFTIIPRQRFNGLEILRTLNFREIAADDYAAYYRFFSADGRLNGFMKIS